MNIYAKFGVTDQREYADKELCVKVNPEQLWSVSSAHDFRLFDLEHIWSNQVLKPLSCQY